MIVILGPTASGKTRLATHLAHRIGGEIVSADSRQVYRGMNIGTGKDLYEYVVAGKPIPYHLIDIRDAGEKYNVHEFRQDAAQAIREIGQRQRVPILCGGTGLYIQALLSQPRYTGVPIDQPARDILETYPHDDLLAMLKTLPLPDDYQPDLSTRKRTIRAIEIARYLATHPDFEAPVPEVPDYLIFGLNPPVDTRRERISRRLHERLQNGLIEEVRELLAGGILPADLIYYGLEYKFVTEHLIGLLSYDAMVQRLETEIHRFAKRQMTYFRKMERDSMLIHWLDPDQGLEQWIQKIVSNST
jgi:tRNA dimethylallyltransferase